MSERNLRNTFHSTASGTSTTKAYEPLAESPTSNSAKEEENHGNDLQSNAKGDKSLLWILLAIVTAIPTAVLTLFATFDFNLGKDPVTKECRTTIQPVLHWNLELPTIICLICILALLWIVFTSKSNTTKKDHMHSEIFIAAQLLSTFLMSSMFIKEKAFKGIIYGTFSLFLNSFFNYEYQQNAMEIIFPCIKKKDDIETAIRDIESLEVNSNRRSSFDASFVPPTNVPTATKIKNVLLVLKKGIILFFSLGAGIIFSLLGYNSVICVTDTKEFNFVLAVSFCIINLFMYASARVGGMTKLCDTILQFGRLLLATNNTERTEILYTNFLPLSKTAFKDSRKDSISNTTASSGCAWTVNATSYYRSNCNMRHVSVFVLKCIHFISSPIISFFFAIVIFRFLRTFFQYTFVLGVINWINLLDIHYEIPLEYYGLLGDIGSSASYALYSLSAIQILPCINNLIQGLNLYLNKLKPNSPLLNLYISFLIVVQIVCIAWNTGAGAYGAAVMISKSVDGVNPTHMQIVATVINSKSLMLYLSELLVRKIDDINDPTIRKMSSKSNGDDDSRSSCSSNPQSRSTGSSVQDDDVNTDDKHPFLKYQYNNYGSIHEKFEEEMKLFEEEMKISGFFSTINLQEGSNIILFNDDMKIGIEDNKNDEMMHTTLNQQMNNSNVFFQLILNL